MCTYMYIALLVEHWSRNLVVADLNIVQGSSSVSCFSKHCLICFLACVLCNVCEILSTLPIIMYYICVYMYASRVYIHVYTCLLCVSHSLHSLQNELVEPLLSGLYSHSLPSDGQESLNVVPSGMDEGQVRPRPPLTPPTPPCDSLYIHIYTYPLCCVLSEKIACSTQCTVCSSLWVGST